MNNEYTILIADRNRHVCEFLKREFEAEGFQVRLSESGSDVLKIVFHYQSPDFIIIDPDLPDTESNVLLKRLGDRIPELPVIIHAFSFEEIDYSRFLKKCSFVEKSGQSVESLKRKIFELLKENKKTKMDSSADSEQGGVSL